MIERVDAMFAAGECPDAIVVFVDCWTSYGGSQFLNSSSLGRYQDYLCDEAVAFVDDRYPTAADRDHRGLTGKSSGGYGAMVVPMMRPDVFGGLASHAGDALFEACEPPKLRRGRAHACATTSTAPTRSSSSAWRRPTGWTGTRYGAPLEMYGYAAAYSPDPANPGKALLPFDVATGRLIDDVWAQWLDKDPVRMAPAHADALRSMRRIYLDAGRRDEFFLDLGAQAFAAELDALGVRLHARAVRRQARRPHVPLPGRDPRAGARVHSVIGRSPSRHQASTAGHGP